MKIVNNLIGSFYVAQVPGNFNTVLITDSHEIGCLKILANADKYFKTYYPTFYHYTRTLKRTKVTDRFLKQSFIQTLTSGYKWTREERQNLADYFKINLDKYLGEKQKGWHKDHYNYNKAEKWERKPAKRKTPARNVKKQPKRR